MTNQTILETFPMVYSEPINVESKCLGPKETPLSNITWSSDMPEATFATLEELHFADYKVPNPPITHERGSTCCVPFVGFNGEKLLLGISHSKTRFMGKE